MINPTLYKLEEIPQFIPMTEEYLSFWKQEKDRCLQGYWIGGKWMPGNLYFYINYWNIELKESATSKNAKVGNPFLRDIDWDFAYAYMEARGFSRFEKQTLEEVVGKTARQIMQTIYKEDMGKPLFENQAKNIILVGNRGFGKSFMVSGQGIGYEFLFEREKGMKNQIVVGAGETKYSADLLKKVKLGLDFLPGSQEFSGRYYPPPFSKRYRGSWESGKVIEARYETYVGGAKIWKGSGSNIKHISYKNNALASNGTRPCLSIFEEAGIFDNLLESWDSSVETVRYGTNQFGTMLALGTGGDMSSGSIRLSEMFYDPQTYNLVEFEDEWENKGKIGMFVPATRGLNDFKDENGNSEEEKAKDYLLKYRDNLLTSGAAKSTIEQEIQYRPLRPSEAFLISSGNVFPRKLLLEQLTSLENSERGKHLSQVGYLDYVDGVMSWKQDPALKQITNFPLKKTDDARGAITIYEHPYIDDDGKVPPYLYIGGCDPYDHDKSSTGSLGSFFIYKRFQDFDNTNDIIVAEYTGRPDTADEYYENVRKLLIYFNAVCLYENERKGMHQYFRIKSCDYLLADQPDYIHDIIRDTHVNRGKGVHMTTQIKDHMEIKVRDWLSTEYKEGHYNTEKIYSIGLLKELIQYNDKGNFDRVIAFMMVLMQDLNMHKIYVKKVQELSANASFFPDKLFSNKPKYDF